MIGQIKRVVIRRNKVYVEMNTGVTLKLPAENLIINKLNGKIVGLKLIVEDSFIPISLLLQSSITVKVDPKVPYHL